MLRSPHRSFTHRVAQPDIRPISADDADAWDRSLTAMDASLLQSWAWGELKRRHGWSVERVGFDATWGQARAQVLFRSRGPVSLAYVPRGPVLEGDHDRAFRALVTHLDRACRKRRAISLIVEPNGPLGLTGTYRTFGFVRGPAPFQPERTVRVPLLPDDQLVAQMHSKNRYSIRLAERRGVEIVRGHSDGDLGAFYALLRETSGRNAFGIHAFDYYADAFRLFGDDACLLFAMVDGQIAATGMAARFGSQAVYLYGASSTTVRGDGATFRLQYDLMRWARDQGATSYDLWGIPTHDPERAAGAIGAAQSRGEDQSGLFTFKTRFGGEIVRFPWPMERRYAPLLSVAAQRLGVVRG